MAGGKDHAANKQGRVAAGNAQGGNESNRAVKRPKKKVVPPLGGVVPATSEHASSAGRPVTAPLTGLSQPGAGIHLPHLPAHMDPSSTLQHYMAHMGSQHDPAMAAMVFRAMPFGGAGSSQRHSGTYLIGGSGPSPYAGAPLLPQMQNHGMAARPGGMGGLAAIEMSELASKRWRTVIKALNCLRLSDEASKAVQEALRVELNHGPHSDSDDEREFVADLIEKAICEAAKAEDDKRENLDLDQARLLSEETARKDKARARRERRCTVLRGDILGDEELLSSVVLQPLRVSASALTLCYSAPVQCCDKHNSGVPPDWEHGVEEHTRPSDLSGEDAGLWELKVAVIELLDFEQCVKKWWAHEHHGYLKQVGKQLQQKLEILLREEPSTALAIGKISVETMQRAGREWREALETMKKETAEANLGKLPECILRHQAVGKTEEVDEQGCILIEDD